MLFRVGRVVVLYHNQLSLVALVVQRSPSNAATWYYPLGYRQKVNRSPAQTKPHNYGTIRWATGKRLTDRLPKLSLITMVLSVGLLVKG